MNWLVCLILLITFNSKGISQNWAALGVGVDGNVRCIFADTVSDLLYVGGDFINGGGINARGIASWNGTQWDTLGKGLDNNPPTSSTSGYPLAMCRFNNKLYIGGDFTQAGLVNSPFIASWNGTDWESFPSNPNQPVTAMMVHENDLYICGLFDSVGNVPANGLAKWDGNTWSDVNALPNYNASLSSRNAIFSMAVFQGNLYIAGNFEGTAGYKEIVYWDGSLWQSLDGGILGSAAEVSSMSVFQNELYVAGTFTSSAGNSGNYIQKWNGFTWQDVGGGVSGINGGNGQIWDLKVIQNDLYAVGVFTTVGGVEGEKIAKWDGNQWCGFGDSIYSNILEIETYHDSIFVGGMFPINSDTVNSIAKWMGGNFVDTCGSILGVIHEQIAQNLNIYPNPTKNHITIEYLIASSEVNLSIQNILGQSIQSLTLSRSDNKVLVDVNEYPPGIYFILLQNEEKTLVKKFIKE